jgi:hypothetical protein
MTKTKIALAAALIAAFATPSFAQSRYEGRHHGYSTQQLYEGRNAFSGYLGGYGNGGYGNTNSSRDAQVQELGN